MKRISRSGYVSRSKRVESRWLALLAVKGLRLSREPLALANDLHSTDGAKTQSRDAEDDVP